MNKRATMKDVALAAGVSEATVSRALSGSSKVSARTLQKVQQAAEILQFNISKSASSLASGKTKRIGVLVPDRVSTWFNSHVLDGAYKAAEKTGYELVPYIIRSESDLDIFFARLPIQGDIDAFLVLSFNLSSSHLKALKSLRVPSIGVDTPSTEGFTASVGIDEKSTMQSVVNTLNRFGHKTIAYVGGSTHARFSTSVPTRQQSFVSALRTEGIDTSKYLIFDDYRTPQEAVAQLLQSSIAPTAVCAEDDVLAVALYKEFTRLGVKIPTEISLIGFDNQEIADFAELTTVSQDPVSLGQEAVKIAVDILNSDNSQLSSNPQRSKSQHTILPTELILRSTLGSAPVQ